MRMIAAVLLILIAPPLLTMPRGTEMTVQRHLEVCPHCREPENNPILCREVMGISSNHSVWKASR